MKSKPKNIVGRPPIKSSTPEECREEVSSDGNNPNDEDSNDEEEKEVSHQKPKDKGISYYSSLRRQLREVETTDIDKPSVNQRNESNDSKSYQKTKRFVLKKEKSQKEETNGMSTFLYWFRWILVVIIPLIVSYILFGGERFFTNNGKDISLNTNKWQTFENEFISFEQKYSEVIPNKGFKIMKSSVINVMKRNERSQHLDNTSPAIILLISSKDNQNILKCVKRDFVGAINKAYNEKNTIIINGSQTDATDIIDKFDQNFRDQQKHSIIIENVESIPPEDVMSLHQFTDHENSKYKNVIIIITAIYYQTFNLSKSANSNQMDSIASQLFEVKWKNALSGEQRFALISRLTPSVVTLILPQNSFQC